MSSTRCSAELDDTFEAMYATGGRRSVPPETLLKATVLMAMYSIRSERAFCERLNYDLLFKWFLDMRIDEPAFDASTFSKNRQRLLDHEVADEFFAAVVARPSCAATCRAITSPSTARCWRRGRRTRASSRKIGRRVIGPPARPQRRVPVARRETLQRHPRLDDRSRRPAGPQVERHRRQAVLRRAPVDGASQRVDRRRRAHRRDRLRRTRLRRRDARPAPRVEAAAHRRR